MTTPTLPMTWRRHAASLTRCADDGQELAGLDGPGHAVEDDLGLLGLRILVAAFPLLGDRLDQHVLEGQLNLLLGGGLKHDLVGVLAGGARTPHIVAVVIDLL